MQFSCSDILLRIHRSLSHTYRRFCIINSPPYIHRTINCNNIPDIHERIFCDPTHIPLRWIFFKSVSFFIVNHRHRWKHWNCSRPCAQRKVPHTTDLSVNMHRQKQAYCLPAIPNRPVNRENSRLSKFCLVKIFPCNCQGFCTAIRVGSFYSARKGDI